MRIARIVIVFVVLSTLGSVQRDVSACTYRCDQPPEGVVVCQADCEFPANCVTNSELRCDQYCYYDLMVGACHEGTDTCCKVGPGGF